jgi:hypothetical protein
VCKNVDMDRRVYARAKTATVRNAVKQVPERDSEIGAVTNWET